MDWLQLINDLLPVLGEALRKMGKAITLKRCRITMVIAAEEADQTAIRYGRANALLYTIYAFLGRHIRVKEFKAELRQDYLSGPEGESAEADPAGAGMSHDPSRGGLSAAAERRKNLSAVCKITLRLSSGGFFL